LAALDKAGHVKCRLAENIEVRRLCAIAVTIEAPRGWGIGPLC